LTARIVRGGNGKRANDLLGSFASEENKMGCNLPSGRGRERGQEGGILLRRDKTEQDHSNVKSTLMFENHS